MKSGTYIMAILGTGTLNNYHIQAGRRKIPKPCCSTKPSPSEVSLTNVVAQSREFFLGGTRQRYNKSYTVMCGARMIQADS